MPQCGWISKTLILGERNHRGRSTHHMITFLWSCRVDKITMGNGDQRTDASGSKWMMKYTRELSGWWNFSISSYVHQAHGYVHLSTLTKLISSLTYVIFQSKLGDIFMQIPYAPTSSLLVLFPFISFLVSTQQNTAHMSKDLTGQ
jgi:hypothetical protein